MREAQVSNAVSVGFGFDVRPKDRHVLILRGYFDESGKRNQTPVVAVGGFVFRAGEWKRFEKRWWDAIDSFGLPEDHRFFHMNKFAVGAPPFREEEGWDKPTKESRLRLLLDLICEYALFSTGSIVPVSSYETNVSAWADKHMGGPYGMASAACFMQMGKVLRLHPEAKVAAVWESGGEAAGPVIQTYNLMTRTPLFRKQTRLQSFMFGDKRVFAALQAADILAYELGRRGATQLQLDERVRREFVLGNFWHRIKFNHWTVQTDETMSSWSRVVSLDLTGAKMDVENEVIYMPDGSVHRMQDL